jgi:hypothetical protein
MLIYAHGKESAFSRSNYNSPAEVIEAREQKDGCLDR